MKRIVDIPDEVLETKRYCQYFGVWSAKLSETIDNSIPCNPSGDLISREALKEECANVVKGSNNSDFIVPPTWNKAMELIDNAQAVPLPNEQIAWEKGYEAGLAQGKHEQTAEWRDNLIEVFRASAEIGGDVFHLSEVERIINGEPIWKAVRYE